MSGKFMMNGVEYLGGGGGGGNVDDVYVNGESVLDENKIAQITSYKEVTQSEYEALPASKLSDGVAYFISDSVEAEGFPPRIYSLQEREIGVWVDGKPLYEKTYYIPTLPSSKTTESLATNLLNIDKIFVKEGFAFSSTVSFPINTVRPQYDLTDGIGCYVGSTGAYIRIEVGSDRSNFSAYVTLCYTKTTDTAGSGIWAGNGAMTHHYSTDEVIVGTWIDGKPLYEKIVTINRTIQGGQWVQIPELNDLNIEMGVDIVLYSNSNTFYGCQWDWNSTPNEIYVLRSVSIDLKKILVRYTKTTD